MIDLTRLYDLLEYEEYLTVTRTTYRDCMTITVRRKEKEVIRTYSLRAVKGAVARQFDIVERELKNDLRRLREEEQSIDV